MNLKEIKMNTNNGYIFKEKITFDKLQNLLFQTEYKDEILNKLEPHINTSELEVVGSQELLEKVLDFEKSIIKEDFILKLEDTNFKFFCPPKENIDEKISEFEIEIPTNSDKKIIAESSYVVKADYNNLLEIKSLYDACSNKQTSYSDEILRELKTSYFSTYNKNKEILGSLKDKKKMYRIIKCNNKVYIRAIVGTKYKDYNNLIALYFGLYALNSIAKYNHQHFEVQNVKYTDSEFKISFSRLKTKNKKVEDIFLGIDLYNNELGKGSIILAISYYLKYEGKMIQLNPNENIHKIEHRILSIPHKVKIDTAIDKILTGIKDMDRFEEELIEISNTIKNNPLTEQLVNNIVEKLTNNYTKKIEQNSKTKIKKLRENINMTIGIAGFFGELNDLNMEFSEKEYVSHICYKLLKNWNRK